jgi:hypothetical protein
MYALYIGKQLSKAGPVCVVRSSGAVCLVVCMYIYYMYYKMYKKWLKD